MKLSESSVNRMFLMSAFLSFFTLCLFFPAARQQWTGARAPSAEPAACVEEEC